MVELMLEAWTAEQREALGFLLDDANISAIWSPSSVSVAAGSVARVQRFIDFVATPAARADVAAVGPALPVLDALDPHDAGTEADLAVLAGRLGISDVATPGLRLGGFLIDTLIVTLAMLPVALLSGWTATWAQVGLAAGYEIGMVGLLGQTLGNMAVRTRVVRLDDGGRPGLYAGLVRWFALQIGFLVVLAAGWSDGISLLWAIVVFGPILRGPTYRGLHDRAAGVMVLDDRLTARRSHPAPSNEPHAPS